MAKSLCFLVLAMGVEVESSSCNSICQAAGGGHGTVIGTAPSCGGSCSGDCPNNVFCITATDDMSDYGHHCWHGDKVCCCKSSFDESVQNKSAYMTELTADEPAEMTEDVAEPSAEVAKLESMTDSANGEEVEGSSCKDICVADGCVYGSVIGTAPACGASCSHDCPGSKVCFTATSDMSDYGHGCAHGDKVCCCVCPSDDFAGFLAAKAAMSTVEVTEEATVEEPATVTEAVAEPNAEVAEPESMVTTADKVEVEGSSCKEICVADGCVYGSVIGTAPACGASCSHDCPGSKVCFTATSDMSDYGHGCAHGDKVCCCVCPSDDFAGFLAVQAAMSAVEVTEATVEEPAITEAVAEPNAEVAEPESMVVTTADGVEVAGSSCKDICVADGCVYGSVIGTAPACDASCSHDCAGQKVCFTATSDMSDYGHGCAHGDKICCCICPSDNFAGFLAATSAQVV